MRWRTPWKTEVRLAGANHTRVAVKPRHLAPTVAVQALVAGAAARVVR